MSGDNWTNEELDALARDALLVEDGPNEADLDAYVAGTLDDEGLKRVRAWFEDDSEILAFQEAYDNVASETVARTKARLSDAQMDELASAFATIKDVNEEPETRVEEDTPIRLDQFRVKKWAWPLTTLAAAAAVLLVVMPQNSDVLPPSGLSSPIMMEQVAKVRGSEAGPSRRLAQYGPDSKVAIEFTQRITEGEPVAVQLKVFRLDDGRLERIRVRVERSEEDDIVTFRVSGVGREMFGPGDGIKKLMFAFGGQGADLSRLGASTLSAAKQRDGIRWVEERLRYVEPGATLTPQTQLLHYSWSKGVGAEQVVGFDSQSLPIVRVKQAMRGSWELRWNDGSQLTKIACSQERDGQNLILRAHVSNALKAGQGRLELIRDDEVVNTWRVEWGRPTSSMPQVIAAAQLRKDSKLDEAKAILADSTISSDPWVRLWAYVELGKIHYRANEIEQTKLAWRLAAELAREQEVYSELSARLRAIAYIETTAKNFSRAEELLSEALSIDKSIDNFVGINRSEYYLARVYWVRRAPRAYFDAKTRYERAQETAFALGDKEAAYSFVRTLAVHVAMHEDFKEAIHIMDSVAEDLKGDPYEQVAYSLISKYIDTVKLTAYRASTREWKEELVSFESAKLSPQTMSAQWRYLYYFLKAELELRAGEYELAEQTLKTFSAEKGAKNSSDWNMLHVIEFDVAKAQRDFARMKSIVDRLTGKFNGNRAGWSVFPLILSGDLALLRGEKSEAQTYYLAALSEADEVSRRFYLPQSRVLLRSTLARGLESLVSLLVEDGNIEEAFQVVQRARMRNLLELDRQARVDESSPEWKVYLASREDFAIRFPGGCRGASAPQKAECHATEASVNAALDIFYASGWGPQAQTEEPEFDTSALFARLQQGQAVLSVARLPDERWAGFWVQSGTVRVRVGEDPVALWTDELPNVSHLLLDPGQHKLAFDAAAYLVQEAATMGHALNVTLVPYAGLVGRPVGSTDGRWLVVADPDGTLPQARVSGRALAHRQPGARLLTGDAATRNAVTEQWVNADVFHFSGHGEVLGRNPWRTKLRLADGQFLTLQDVLAAHSVPRVVVLAGCQTGLHGGAGEVGLPHAFLMRGAHAVLATVEDVPDRSARAFVQAFYDEGGATDPAGAFQRAVAQDAGGGVGAAFRLWGGW